MVPIAITLNALRHAALSPTDGQVMVLHDMGGPTRIMSRLPAFEEFTYRNPLAHCATKGRPGLLHHD
jgi:hypothetical protein